MKIDCSGTQIPAGSATNVRSHCITNRMKLHAKGKDFAFICLYTRNALQIKNGLHVLHTFVDIAHGEASFLSLICNSHSFFTE